MKYFYTLLLLTALTVAKTQTIHIDPATNGGFESGASFSDNGWTRFDFQSSVNQWTVGTAPAGLTGTRAAFMSNTFAQANPTHTLAFPTAAEYRQFYNTNLITIPATDSSIILSFRWMATFATSASNFFTVYADTTNTTPSATFRPTTTLLNSTLGTGGVWTDVRIALAPEFAGKQIRLFFTSTIPVSANSSAGLSAPAVDDISFTSRSTGSTIQSTTSGGNWFAPSTWVGGRIPEYFDDVVIPAGSTVTLDRAVSNYINSLTINGTYNVGSGISTSSQFINKNLRIASTGVANLTTTVVATYTVGGDITLDAGATADFRNIILNNFRSIQTNANRTNRLIYSDVTQFTGSRISGIQQLAAGNYIIQGNGTLTFSNRVYLTGTLTTQGVTLVFDNTTATSPTVPLFLTTINGGSFATRPSFGANVTYGVTYTHTSTPSTPFLVGSANELPVNRVLARIINGNANAFLRIDDDLTLTGTAATAPTQFFGPVVVDAGKTIFFTNTTSLIANNNGNVQGAIQYAIPVASNVNYTFPVGWGIARRQITLTGVTTTAASQIRVSTVAEQGGAAGTGMQVLSPLFRWRIQVISGTVTNVNSISFEYNAAADGLLAADTAERRIAATSTINGIYENVGPTTPNSSAVIALPTGNYNQDQFFALGKSSGGFAKTWTGNASTLNWGDAANWSNNTLPACTDEVNLAAGFATIVLPANATAGNLTIGQFTTLNIKAGNNFTIGCGTAGGSRLLNIGTGTLLVEDGGTLHVNGGIFLPNTNARFTQTGGAITIDPIAANDTLQVAALQLGTTTAPISFNTAASLSGGTLRFVDPGKTENIQYFGGTSINISATANHSTIFGSTTSTQTDEFFNGFRVNLAGAGATAPVGQLNLGNVVIEGSTTPGRWFFTGAISAVGNVTVNTNGDLRSTGAHRIGGNFTNNGRTFRSNIIFGIPVASNTVATSTTPSIFTNNGSIEANYSILSTINTAGSGYTRGDVLTLQGGTFTTPATYLVRTVDAAGAITLATMIQHGNYTVEPTTPYTFTGGSGTGFTATPTITSTNTIRKTADFISLQVFNNVLQLVNPIHVLNQMTFGVLSAKIEAAANASNTMVTLGSADVSPVVTGVLSSNNTNFVTVPFRRAISVQTTAENNNTSLFPVGNGETRRSIGINYTTAPTAPGYITAEFVAQNPGTVGALPTDAGNVALAAIAPEGFWRITSSGGLTGGVFNVRASARNFAGLNSGVDHRLVNRTNNTSAWQLVGSHANIGLADTIKRNDVSSFGEYALAFTNATLPVKINRFSGVRNGSNNQLAWQTAQELNNSHFVVEFSANGQNYTPVGTVQTRAQNGTSAQALNYQFTHTTHGNAYYRLQQVDKNGMIAYSQVVYLAAKTASNVQVYPTLVTNQLNVALVANSVERVQIQVADAAGKIVARKLVETITGANVFSLPVENLLAGSYYVQVKKPNETVTIAVIKQ